MKGSKALLVMVLMLSGLPRIGIAHDAAAVEEMGCGGIFIDYMYKWWGHEYVKLTKASVNTGPWGTVEEWLPFTACYGPAQRRQWYKAWFCSGGTFPGSMTNCGSWSYMEKWIPREPCL